MSLKSLKADVSAGSMDVRDYYIHLAGVASEGMQSDFWELIDEVIKDLHAQATRALLFGDKADMLEYRGKVNVLDEVRNNLSLCIAEAKEVAKEETMEVGYAT